MFSASKRRSNCEYVHARSFQWRTSHTVSWNRQTSAEPMELPGHHAESGSGRKPDSQSTTGNDTEQDPRSRSHGEKCVSLFQELSCPLQCIRYPPSR